MSITDCASTREDPERFGAFLGCSGDAGHKPDHYVENDRGEIVWRWTDSGQPVRVTWR